MPKQKKDMGARVRGWLTEKMGNPVMPSKEKEQIRQLEEEERKMRERQENGEDYPAQKHVRANWKNRA